MSDTCLTWERLGHGCLRVRGVSSRKIILFYSGHGSDTFQTRLRHSNVKIERKKEKKKGTLQASCTRATETLRSPFLSLMCCCLLSSYCMCLPFSFCPSAFQSRRSSCCVSLFSISLLFFFFLFFFIFFNPHACSVGWETYTLVVFSVHWDWVPCFH